MTCSSAKKKRLKQVREGKRDPEQNRGNWNGMNPLERRTPTLEVAKQKMKNKHKLKWNQSQYSDDSIFLFI